MPNRAPAGEYADNYGALLATFEEAGFGFTTLDAESGRFLFVNDALCSILGRKRDELLQGPPFLDYLAPEDVPGLTERLRRRTAGEPVEGAAEARILHKQGHVVQAESFATTVRVGGRLQIVALVRDIGERKTQENRLQESEGRFRAIVESTPDAIVVIGEDGRIRLVSGRCEQVFGYARGELAGQTIEVLVPEQFRKGHSGLRDGYFESPQVRPMWAGVDLHARRKDGTQFPVEITLVPLPTASGTLVAAMIRDITQQKRAAEVLQDAYEREQEATARLRALDEMKNAFLLAVSHDLRSPLTVVVGLAETLGVAAGRMSPEQTKEVVDRIHANAERLDRMLTDLLDVDRLSRGIIEPRLEPTDLPALVRRIVDYMDIRDRPVSVETEDVVAMLDPPKIERVVENLLANATRHAPEGTPVWIRVTREPEGVLVVVEDAGPGVPDRLKEEVFKMFRRGDTPRVGGTGVGLALVQRFTELHGGRVWVEDRPGGGASFRVLLPESDSRS